MADVVPTNPDIAGTNDINTKMNDPKDAKDFIENLTKEVTSGKFTSFEKAKACCPVSMLLPINKTWEAKFRNIKFRI